MNISESWFLSLPKLLYRPDSADVFITRVVYNIFMDFNISNFLTLECSTFFKRFNNSTQENFVYANTQYECLF